MAAEDNFEQILEQELINYGGFSPQIAKKVVNKEGSLEVKTAELVQVCKNIKEGLIEID